MSLVDNERAKLSATYLNGLATAVMAVGGFAPLGSFPFSEIVHSKTRADRTQRMSNLEFIVAFSLMPIGALIVGVVVYLFARPSRQTRLHPGE